MTDKETIVRWDGEAETFVPREKDPSEGVW
jgi:hypothetical protein